LQRPKRTNRSGLWLVGGLVLLLLLAGFAWSVGAARPARAEPAARPATEPAASLPAVDLPAQGQPASDAACRQCHGDTDSVMVFPSNEVISVQVDLAALDASAHGLHGGALLACTDCHSPAAYQFPHQPKEAPDWTSYQLAQSATCERCHTDPHLTSHPGPGSAGGVSCTDCHGAHDVIPDASWADGQGVEKCLACHEKNEVTRFDAGQLTEIVQNGLFTQTADNNYCLACHTQDFNLVFENGDVLSLQIDPQALHDSVHGAANSWQALECYDCHGEYNFPHDPARVTSARGFSLRMYEACARCHEQNYQKNLDGVHGMALQAGNTNAAVCTDCHGYHNVPPPDEPRERISTTCEKCHSTIFNEYAASVHGDALLTESNPDVPTCINCHGVHDINSPTTTLFRIRSPQLCATCHADEELMNQYDISTEVFDTYVADFHGTTWTLFDPQDPNADANKAVCYDCHGVHDIRPVDDPENGIKANLLETCQQCHPDASESFSSAWLGHYVPSLDNYPIIYLVNLFYRIVIPATVGFFGFLVVTDIFRRIRTRIR
jgi:predicted CXXCH cytochrome family protein